MIIPAANRLSDLREYYFSQKMREVRELQRRGVDVINLGIGSPDLPPPQRVSEALRESSTAPNAHAYQPYRGIRELRQAMASWRRQTYQVALDPERELLPLMGSKAGVVYISQAFLNPGDRVLTPNPGYPAYASAAMLAGATAIPYSLTEEQHWLPDWRELESLDTAGVKLMWVNYPHMPTGAVASRKDFARLIAFAKERRILLCHDNPYSLILNPSSPQSILSIPGGVDCGLELNSLSKSFHMAGWRIGMVAGAEAYIAAIFKVLSNTESGMFLPLQQAAIRALQTGAGWHEQQNRIYRVRRNLVYTLLDTLGCTCQSGAAGMFVWGKLPDRQADAIKFTDALLYRAGVFTAPGTIFGSNGEGFVRVSLCAPGERIEEAIERVRGMRGIHANLAAVSGSEDDHQYKL